MPRCGTEPAGSVYHPELLASVNELWILSWVWSSTLGGVLVGLFASGPMARVGLLTVMLRLWVTGDTSLTKLAAHTSAYLSVLQMLIWLSMDYAKRLRT